MCCKSLQQLHNRIRKPSGFLAPDHQSAKETVFAQQRHCQHGPKTRLLNEGQGVVRNIFKIRDLFRCPLDDRPTDYGIVPHTMGRFVQRFNKRCVDTVICPRHKNLLGFVESVDRAGIGF